MDKTILLTSLGMDKLIVSPKQKAIEIATTVIIILAIIFVDKHKQKHS